MEKWILISYPCPECEVGSIFAVKNKRNNTLCAYCEECDTLWKIPEDIGRQIYLENWQEEFEWGGYANLDEVKAFGWGKYIKK